MGHTESAVLHIGEGRPILYALDLLIMHDPESGALSGSAHPWDGVVDHFSSNVTAAKAWAASSHRAASSR